MVIRIKKMRARKTPPKNPSPGKVKQKISIAISGENKTKIVKFNLKDISIIKLNKKDTERGLLTLKPGRH